MNKSTLLVLFFLFHSMFRDKFPQTEEIYSNDDGSVLYTVECTDAHHITRLLTEFLVILQMSLWPIAENIPWNAS